jgi:hypothetical protein
LDADSYRPYERHEIRVILDLSEDVHVFGSPVPNDYTPLRVDVAPFEGLETEAVRLPQPSGVVSVLTEPLPIHTGRVEAVVPFNIVPRMDVATLTVEVTFQACRDTVCYPSDRVQFDLVVKGVDLIRD